MGDIDISQVSGGVQEAASRAGLSARPEKAVAPTQKVDPIEHTKELSEVASSAVELAADSVSPERLAELVEVLREAMPSNAQSLRFQMDEVLDRPVVTVIDDVSGEVIRQLPSDEVVRAAHNIEYMRGVLFEDWS